MKDRCVVCGAETPYDIMDDIFIRLHYIEGVGQLCAECFTEIYEDDWIWEEK